MACNFETNTLTVPSENDLFTMIRAVGSQQAMHDAVKSTFRIIQDQLSQSMYFLYYLLEFPDLSKIQALMLLRSHGHLIRLNHWI
mmetsp:Transcript_8902/g.19265  ORF Transcript_8902/g.19265 Transcript_8902/m.19265 type:complete len:85 (-) Transcript_8902:55-309(-)